VLPAMGQAISERQKIRLTDKYINPLDGGKAHEKDAFRIIEFELPAHGLSNVTLQTREYKSLVNLPGVLDIKFLFLQKMIYL